ncbi:YggT family protein [Gluconacetobacter azotocaptans]|uniref:YggT family protein n=1 Tax=Gluconacetobacter azotocaptans TaxID=142834 RepID=A0A7W4JR29_9PROT|nr:YggT family protein [Gluconacetobacter azotocaptans]MBB2189369.1 YggT family protein [Gluconacetobacter azotocaptans]MBM9401236.1 YggT family protein [Gluconacetobacter azotocaptans]
MITLVFTLLFELIRLYTWVLVISCVFSFLYGFGVLDPRNRIVWNIGSFLNRLTEPVLQPIRRILPAMGNMDFSPLVLLLLIQYLLTPLLRQLYFALIIGGIP